MTTRRNLLLAFGAGGLAVVLPALAQQEKRVRRIGYFSGGSLRGGQAAYLPAFRDGMAALHWVEGRDYVIAARYADGLPQTLPGLAAELMATQPDLLLVTADEPARQLAQRTKTIPIVFTTAQDPMGTGLVTSLQRPGGNATGLTSLARELSAKRLQLLKEAFSTIAHVVLLFQPDNPGNALQAKEIQEAAPRLGMRITPIALRQPADIEPAFKRGSALRAHAYILAQGGVVSSQGRAIAERMLRLRVPAMYPANEYVEAGGLMSYSASAQDNFRRAAGYVDKIFKGAKPGELPVEQPLKFELVLNLKTAGAMGIRFPQSFLARADRVLAAN